MIELLVVITIIGILITLVVVVAGPVQRKSRDAKRKAEVNTMLTALNLFKTDFKVYPNYTMYLGTSVSVGAKNSNFDLGSDLPACTSLVDGNPTNFANFDPAHPGDYNYASLKTGFLSVDHFLICLRYLDRKLIDPRPNPDADTEDDYHYRVSFDYGDVLLSAKLENINDSDARTLFDVTDSNKRYYLGSGVLTRHLDEDSNVNTFFTNLSGTSIDGLYLYQCRVDSAGVSITEDNRVGYEPIKANGIGGWIKNASCRDQPLTTLADLHVVSSK